MAQQLAQIDLWVIGAYFLAIFSVAVYFYLARTREKSLNATDNYFMGGKSLGWLVIGASLFASNIGSEHLIGLAGQGASGDFVAGQFELLAALILIVLGWFFVPFYMRSSVYTMPEFLERRYSRWARGYLTWVSIIAYVLTKISVTIFAGGIVFTTLLHIPFWTGAILIVIFTGIYTVAGGLKVVVYTDLIQMIVLLGGSFALTYYGLEQVGGWDALVSKTSPEHLSLWRGLDDPDFPWTGILLGAPILGVWYWCTDQFIVQRVIAARNLEQARKGSIFGGYLKLLPLFLFVIPGVIAYALAQGPDAVLQFPVENGQIQYDAALPALTVGILPAGLKGLVIAGLLAALMSSLSSVFNSCSTLFTMDIYRHHFPNTDARRLVRVGQIATAVLVLLGLAWIPMMKLIEGGLFQKLQSIQAYISPPIAAVFLIGIFNRRITARAAKYALLTGGLLGSSRLILELQKERLADWLLPFVQLNFLHFAFLLFVLCVGVLFAFSHRAEQRDVEEIRTITYERGSLSLKGQRTTIWLSVLLLLLLLGIWISFP